MARNKTSLQCSGDPVKYVTSKNLHRRHLSAGQRSLAAAKSINFYRDQAKERQKQAGGDRKSEEYKKSVPAQVPEAINSTESDELF